MAENGRMFCFRLCWALLLLQISRIDGDDVGGSDSFYLVDVSVLSDLKTLDNIHSQN